MAAPLAGPARGACGRREVRKSQVGELPSEGASARAGGSGRTWSDYAVTSHTT